jgi:hypothetical protein
MHQRSGVGEHDRVVVDVDDAGLRRDRLHHLVQVGLGGDPGADIQELADAAFRGQEPSDPVHEMPVGPHADPHRGPLPECGFGGQAVSRVVILASEYVVVNAGAVGPIQTKIQLFV